MTQQRGWLVVAVGVVITVGLVIAAGWLAVRWYRSSDSNSTIRQWLQNPQAHPDWHTPALLQCPDAPFVIPSSGFIGLLWRDTAAPYNALRRHTGIDIFGRYTGDSIGTIPVYAAYGGLLTRLDNWRSSVIIQHDDPLQPGRTIWTYYTHMADTAGNSFISSQFPPGTSGYPVAQGDLLGYQGDYNPAFPVALHLHFSIVTSEPDGSFRNEAILENTLDPSPYFGMNLNADTQPARPVTCR